MSVQLVHAIKSYARIRTFSWRHASREDLAAWQQKELTRWLRDDVPKVEAFASLAGTRIDLTDLPVMEKADLMADFSRYNTERITNDQGWAAFDSSRQIGDFIVGASTGTSGNRGLFVISQRERFAWLGAILAKAVPDFWRHKDRVAVLLPINTPLYDSANKTRRLQVRFFDITQPLESSVEALRTFDPSILIAPPRILRQLTEMDISLEPRLVFSAAEKLEQFDQQIIERHFAVCLREIYMATEGLLGVTCSKGRLHLSEDCMHFEFQPADEGLVNPIISDFNRRTQIMARYRMNDLLRLDTKPCPCGSPLMVVEEVVGRQDDVFELLSAGTSLVEITPDVLRNAIVDTDRSIEDFRLIQTGPMNMSLQLPSSTPTEIAQRVRQNLLTVLKRCNVSPDCSVDIAPWENETGGKLRRIKRT